MTLYQVIKASGWEERRQGNNEIIVKKIEREILYNLLFLINKKRNVRKGRSMGRQQQQKKSQNNACMTGDSIKGQPAKRKRTKSDSSAWRHLSCRTHVGISSDDIAQKIKST